MNRSHLTFLTILLLSAGQVCAEEALVSKGREVYQLWCAPCHAPGANHPGTNALAAKYKGEIPPALEQRPGLTYEFIAQYVRHGVSIMPFFRKTEISDEDLQAIAAYLGRDNK